MSQNATDTKRPEESCPPCLPFCGLGKGEGLASRVAACGASLVEETVEAARRLSPDFARS